MFEIKYNKDHAISLREHGFSATEISEFLGCSVSWLYNVVKIKPDVEKRKALMQYVVDEYDELHSNTYPMVCKECGAEFNSNNDYSSDDFYSDICHVRHVLDDETAREIYGDLIDKAN